MKDVIAKIRGYFFILKCRYTKKNVSIGQGLKMYCKLGIRGRGNVTIGRNCIVSGIFGDKRQYVTIDTGDPEAVISLGDNARLFAARIYAKFEITIGDDFLVEESGIIDTDFHSINPDRGDPQENKEMCRVRIGNRVSMGARSNICKGVTIGDDVVICPGSIVNRSIPSGIVVIGNPARNLQLSSGLLGSSNK